VPRPGTQENDNSLILWTPCRRGEEPGARLRARRSTRRLDRFIGRGRADRSIHAAVNATDIIVFSAMLTKPLPYGPDWRRIAERQIAIFVNGLATSGPSDIPGPGVKREDIEKAFAHASLISGKQSDG